MQRSQPLPATNPEFSLLEFPGFREYRVENWRLARDGSGRRIKGTSGWTWQEYIVPFILSLIWLKVLNNPLAVLCLSLLSTFLIWVKCTQVLFESVIVLPPHGIQLETHRGLPSLCLTASRRFIPLAALENFVINEGLGRWDVRYYLAAIKQSGTEDFTLEVAYTNLLPHFPVLLEVYRGVHDLLLDSLGGPQILNDRSTCVRRGNLK